MADSFGTRPEPSHTGRHRMPATLPAWLPDRATAEAWLRQWWVAVASAGMILATLMVVGVVLATRDGDRSAAAAPPGAAFAPADPALDEPDPTPAPTSAAPATPSSTPSATRTSPVNAVDRIAAIAVTAQRLIDSGDLDQRAGREVLRALATATTAVRNGRTERAVEKLRQLDERLAELRADGKLSGAGFAALDVLQPIIVALR